MKIWKNDFTLQFLNEMSKNTMGEYIGIEFTEFGDDYITAKMPVDHRTVQPMRLLHGGASVVLAETLGSVASWLCIDTTRYAAVGLEINANHLRSVKEGNEVFGTARPIRIGKTVHVWNIELKNSRGDLTCVSRLTVSIINTPS